MLDSPSLAGMGKHQDTLSLEEQLSQLKPFWACIWLYNLSISCTVCSDQAVDTGHSTLTSGCTEILDPTAVPPNLPSQELPNRMLRNDRRGVYLHLLDVLQCHICMHPHPPFLGAHVGGNMPQSLRGVVSFCNITMHRPGWMLKSSCRFANAGINIVTDILTAALPIPMIKELQLPKRQRYALIAVFALGGLYVAHRSFTHRSL
jgi:hypothetical protein